MANKRKTQTMNKLNAAFVTLLSQKSFETMTVKELIDEAGISRATFYAHFDDKYDFIHQMETDLLTTLKTMMLAEPYELKDGSAIVTNEAVKRVLTFIQGHMAIVRTLMSSNGDARFFENVKKTAYAILVDFARGHRENALPLDKLPSKYVQNVFVGNVFTIIQTWINEDSECDVDTIFSYIQYAQSTAPVALLNISPKDLGWSK